MSTFLLNEFLAFLTLICMFPGFLPPPDNGFMGWFMVFCMFLCMSVVWWVFVLVAPIAFFISWLMGDLHLSYWTDAWPWHYFFK